jgi:Predicted metal-sulfur cluster biosynthetic enzyme
MTLTSPNCPVAESLPKDVEDKVAAIDDVASAKVEIVFDPPWDKDMMSEEAKLELGFL